MLLMPGFSGKKKEIFQGSENGADSSIDLGTPKEASVALFSPRPTDFRV